jgi:hypothetical protein
VLDGRRCRRYRTAHDPDRQALVKEDPERTRRDIRAAFIFGIVAAALELGALIWFFR